jgi:hypothetical protein
MGELQQGFASRERGLRAHVGEQQTRPVDVATGSRTTDLQSPRHVRFSNRPVGSQALSDYPPSRYRGHSRAHASLRNRHIGPSTMGYENEAEQSLPRPCRQLCLRLSAGPSGHANSPHPSSREGHHSTARWSSSFLLLRLMPHGLHAAAVASLVQRNSVPSTQMRCMITANRRASATMALFLPR